MNQEFMITALAQDHVGLLGKLAQICAKKGINIINLNLSPSDNQGMSSIQMMVVSDKRSIKSLVRQFEKVIEVITAFYWYKPVEAEKTENL